MRPASWLLAASAAATLVGCKIQHDGSFEHDAGFVAASASVAVQIGKPPAPVATPSSAASLQPPSPPMPASAALPSVRPAPVLADLSEIDGFADRTIRVAFRGAPLAMPTVTRTKPEAQARAEEALAKVRAGAAFETVQQDYDDGNSLDMSTAAAREQQLLYLRTEGGIVASLRVGEVSGVFESPFGFHVVERLPPSQDASVRDRR